LVEWLAVPARPWRERAREVAPLGILLGITGIGFLAGRLAVLGDLGGGPPAEGLDGRGIGGRAIAMLPIVLEWGRLLVWPAGLAAQYSPPRYGGSPDFLRASLGGLLALGIVAGWWLTRRRHRTAALGLGWIVVALFPVHNVLFPTGVLIAERTLFLPSVGVVLIAGSLAARLAATIRPRWLVPTAVGALLTLGAARSYSRQAVWRDNPTLFAQTVIDQPRSYRSHFVLGRDLVRRNQPERAAAAFARAAELHSGDHRVFEEWGQILRTAGRCPEAVPIFERGVAADPTGTVARSRLFECLVTLGRFPEARSVARDGLARGSTEFQSALDRAERLERERAGTTR
jgi:hypothetical protein